jgi:hypothetical protein
VIVATRDRATLQALAEREPAVVRLVGVSDEGQLHALQGDPDLVALVDGVTILQSLVTGETAAWLNGQRLLIAAWTVNDLTRVNELVHFGVDAITTDNLAIMELLSGSAGERLRQRASSAPDTSQQPSDDEPNRAGAQQRPGKTELRPPEDEPDLDDFEILGDEEDQHGEQRRHRDDTPRAIAGAPTLALR